MSEEFVLVPEQGRGYPVGLVGERSYQRAILAASPGQHVQILHERGNPYDEQALVVKTAGGEKLGYIARDCWLRDAIHDEGQGCTAVIFAIHPGEHGAGVVVNAVLTTDSIGVCEYCP